MKKNYTILPIIAAALLAGCTNTEETNAPATDGKTALVKLHADVAEKAESRANIIVDGNTFYGEWENGNAMGVLHSRPGTSVYAGPQRFVYNNSTFAFEGELPTETGAWQYMAFYPHAPITGTSASIPFGNLRTQQGNNFNCATDALVAEPLSFSNAAPGMDDDGNPIRFSLSRLTSILNLTVKGGSADDKVRYVLLTSGNTSQVLSAKSFDFDISQMGADAAFNADDRSEVIALGFEPGTAPGSDDVNVFFNVMPGSYDELTFEVITESQKSGSVTVARSPEKPFVAGKLYTKDVPAMTFTKVEKPSFDWPGHDMDEVHEIIDENGDGVMDYPAAIDISVPGGIAGLVVDIVSPALNGLGITRLDLFNETVIPDLEIPYKLLELACTVEIQYKKSCVFDITSLVPMITLLPGADPCSEHTFEVTVTDLAGQQTTQLLTFSVPALPTTATYDENADLWANTASMTISGVNAAAQSVVLEYRIEGETAWNPVTATPTGADGTYKAEIIPTWTEGTNPNGTTIYTVDSKTGIFAKKSYEYRLLVDGDEQDSGSFTPAGNGGDTIPDGDMESSALPCYTLDGSKTTTFWGSGNNGFAETLCSRSTFQGMGGNYCAKLEATMAGVLMFKYLAAGNLFSATFDKPKTTGFVRFGQAYTYTARPTALKLKYHAQIGKVDQNTHSGPLAKNTQDKARIFVCIVDWSAQHEVTSGTAKPTGIWDPETTTDPGEGKIIGYGSLFIEGNTAGDSMIETELKINYYDKVTKPSKAYKLVISCATSAYGDYMNGCSTNVMYVDDFEWVY